VPRQLRGVRSAVGVGVGRAPRVLRRRVHRRALQLEQLRWVRGAVPVRPAVLRRAVRRRGVRRGELRRVPTGLPRRGALRLWNVRLRLTRCTLCNCKSATLLGFSLGIQ
jgi:hypothetical protein